MNSSFNRDRLSELLGLLCDEIIDQAEFQELEQIMQSSAEARQLYHVYTTMACNLQEEVDNWTDHSKLLEQAATELESEASTDNVNSQQPVTKPGVTFPRVSFGGNGLTGIGAFKWMLAAFLLGGLVWFAAAEYSRIDSREIGPFASVQGAVDVVWQSPDDQCFVGQSFNSKRLTIRRGVLHLRFSTGAAVAIEGPADLEIVSENEAFLHEGQVAVYVPEGAEGFRVDTPQTEVVDLGTEFGLSVDATGESQLHVFAGEVEYSGHGDRAEKLILTAGLAVAVDNNGVSRTVELSERSFEVPRKVLWTRYRYSTSISTQFIAGNTTEIAGGVPGRIGGGWTSQWVFECIGGEIETAKTLVRNDNPLGPDLDNHLDVIARNPDGGKFTLKLHRGFESNGEKFDCRENYIVQFLLRVNSDVSKLQRIKVSDSSFDPSVSRHAWKLAANRSQADEQIGELRWRGLPLKSQEDADELRVRKFRNKNPSSKTKSNRIVTTGSVYRVVVEVEPKNSRYRISLSDGKVTLVGDWSKDIQQAAMGDRLERRIEWLFEGEDEISVSVDSIRIQNNAKFSN